MTATSGPSGAFARARAAIDAAQIAVREARLDLAIRRDSMLTKDEHIALLDALDEPQKDRQRKIEDAYRQSLPGESYRKDRSTSGGTS